MQHAQASTGTGATVETTRAVCLLEHKIPESTLLTLIYQGAPARVVLAHTIPVD